MSAPGRVTLEQVLARIDAEPLPDASALADLPLDELERELRRLGVDLEGDVEDLLAAAAGAVPSRAPLASLQAADLARMPLDEVEERLREEGVDPNEFLSRAQVLIRGRGAAGGRGRELPSPGGGPGAAASPSRSARPRRRVPRAVAAGLVLACVSGVAFMAVHEQGLLGPRPSDPIAGPAVPRGNERQAAGGQDAARPAPFPVEAEAAAGGDAGKARGSGVDPGAGPGTLDSGARDDGPGGGAGPAPARPALATAEGRDETATASMADRSGAAPDPAPPSALSRHASPPTEERAVRRDAPGPAVSGAAGASEADRAPVPAAAAKAARIEAPADAPAVATSHPAGSAAAGALSRLESATGHGSESKVMAPAVPEIGHRALRERPASPAGGRERIVERDLAAGDGLEPTLAGMGLSPGDREALLDLLGRGPVEAPGRLRVVVGPAGVREAVLELPGSETVTVRRDDRGRLVAVPVAGEGGAGEARRP